MTARHDHPCLAAAAVVAGFTGDRLGLEAGRLLDEVEALRGERELARDHSNCVCDYCALRPVGDS